MTDILKRLSLVGAIAVMLGGLAACDNTIRGIGEDINDSAEAVEDSTE
jgi:predicted small secreted protein